MGVHTIASAPSGLAAGGDGKLLLHDSYSGRHSCGGRVIARLVGSTRPRERSSLPLKLLSTTGGTRGGSHGSNVHHRGETCTQRMTNTVPLPGTPNVEA
jgi:hypothetical protein